jgi:hypothetical protein
MGLTSFDPEGQRWEQKQPAGFTFSEQSFLFWKESFFGSLIVNPPYKKYQVELIQ